MPWHSPPASLQDQLQLFINFEESKIEKKEEAKPELPFSPYLLKKVYDLDELSVRATNCLKNDNIVYVGDLVQKTEAENAQDPELRPQSRSTKSKRSWLKSACVSAWKCRDGRLRTSKNSHASTRIRTKDFLLGWMPSWVFLRFRCSRIETYVALRFSKTFAIHLILAKIRKLID